MLNRESMAWNDGLASDGSRILLCGLSYLQIISCAGMTQQHAAERLGVDYGNFNRVINRHHMAHWFPPTRIVAAIDPTQVERMARQGLSRQTAAKRLDIPFPTFYRKLRRQGLNNLFPAIGKWSRYAS